MRRPGKYVQSPDLTHIDTKELKGMKIVRSDISLTAIDMFALYQIRKPEMIMMRSTETQTMRMRKTVSRSRTMWQMSQKI